MAGPPVDTADRTHDFDFWIGEWAEVRQLWEVSSDNGATWTTAFDGRYRRTNH